jgi:hypothetical protein
MAARTFKPCSGRPIVESFRSGRAYLDSEPTLSVGWARCARLGAAVRLGELAVRRVDAGANEHLEQLVDRELLKSS